MLQAGATAAAPVHLAAAAETIVLQRDAADPCGKPSPAPGSTDTVIYTALATIFP